MPNGKVLINYVPGEECRVAITENGQLEEYYAEPTNAVSRVGNIYVGRVTNVEAGIQAAFIDFGVEDAGFLHISDLHPQYFPGEDEDTTERVGKKTPRRDRPPIQKALKRGQEIVVQVLKEGIGTKGPTLTSYLSIPGRFLVMMPQMDRVGVSRKVEDEDQRAEMRKILDALDLPEGFGFILRTAGMNRTKTELKRDLAYLQRLWKDMEKRLHSGKSPRLLYSESDLLVRSLRDLLTQEIDEVVIDNETALRRAARFMKIVAPRSQAKLLHYKGKTPIFHAFGITEQIRQIHAREVPLPSGGRLVIDETEALVAIDVNSGKMRSARDAESNAYQVNVEAVDVICRQLRLRDLGGLVINDLIDMRSPKNRKDIENRFRERLKRDRARSTILPISSFGILEMTRQRMRGSHESVHFTGCPSCRGRGVVQKPDSVAADALQDMAALLDRDRVAKVEMVVNSRVAAALLSTRRAALTRIEHLSGKAVEVRISDAIPGDRVTFYAYDGSGADIDLEKLPARSRSPEVEAWQTAASRDEKDWAADLRVEAEEVAQQTAEAFAEAQAVLEEKQHETGLIGEIEGEEGDEGGQPKKKRRRRRRRRRKAEGGAEQRAGAGGAPALDVLEDKPEESAESEADEAQSESSEEKASEEKAARRKRRRRRRRKAEDRGEGEAAEGGAGSREAEGPQEPEGGQKVAELHESSSEAEAPEADGEPVAGQVKKKRRRGRRKTEEGRSEETGGSRGEQPEPKAEESKPERDAAGSGNQSRKKRRRSSKSPESSSNGKAKSSAGKASSQAESKPTDLKAAEAKPKPRSLYGAGRRKLAPSERGKLGNE